MDMELRFALTWVIFWSLFVFVVVWGLVYAAHGGNADETWKFFGQSIKIIIELF